MNGSSAIARAFVPRQYMFIYISANACVHVRKSARARARLQIIAYLISRRRRTESGKFMRQANIYTRLNNIMLALRRNGTYGCMEVRTGGGKTGNELYWSYRNGIVFGRCYTFFTKLTLHLVLW